MDCYTFLRIYRWICRPICRHVDRHINTSIHIYVCGNLVGSRPLSAVRLAFVVAFLAWLSLQPLQELRLSHSSLSFGSAAQELRLSHSSLSFGSAAQHHIRTLWPVFWAVWILWPAFGWTQCRQAPLSIHPAVVSKNVVQREWNDARIRT